MQPDFVAKLLVRIAATGCHIHVCTAVRDWLGVRVYWKGNPRCPICFCDYDTTAVQDGELPYSLSLELVVDDRDVIRALAEYAEGDERNQYALEALKIGVLALRHVGGQMSADLIQRESARLVGDMQQTLDQHMQLLHGRLGDALKEYFDPESGRFNDRVQAARRPGRRAVATDQRLYRRREFAARTHHVRPDRPAHEAPRPAAIRRAAGRAASVGRRRN